MPHSEAIGSWSFDDVRAGRDGRSGNGTGPRALPDLPYLSLEELAKSAAPPREWAVEGLMPLNKTTMLTGKGGVGKSLLAQLLCTCVAHGLPFLGVKTREMPALYVTWEDDAEELWRRQEAISKALGLTLDAGGDYLALVSMADQLDPTLFAIGEGGRGGPTKRGEQFADEIDNIGGLFVFDNASHVYAGDHDRLNEVAQFAHWLNRLAIANVHSINRGPRAGLLLHHPNKAGADWLGSVAYENQFRSRLYLDRPEDDIPNLRRLTNPKANYGPSGGRTEFYWSAGTFILEQDMSADVRAETAEVAREANDNAIFLECLAERTKQQRAVSEAQSSTYAPTVFSGMSESKRIGAKRLTAAMDRLFRRGLIERGLLPWRRDRKPVEGVRLTVPDGCADGAPTRCADAPDHSAPTVRETHPILRINAGAASQGPAPADTTWADAPVDAPDEVDP